MLDGGLPLELPVSIQRNPAVANAWLEASKPDNLSSTTIIYPVPGTSTRLHIAVRDKFPLPQVHMGAVILRTTNFIERHLASHPEDRKSVLDGAHDPMWFESEPGGVILGIWSTAPKRLTYGEVGNVALGLWKALYQEGYYKAASFEIFDRTDGLRKVGNGLIRAGHLRSPRSES
ncbi:MAG: hypothetical protein Q9224_000724 [Gallowayella concinna]